MIRRPGASTLFVNTGYAIPNDHRLPSLTGLPVREAELASAQR